jgi:hypothetical protein
VYVVRKSQQRVPYAVIRMTSARVLGGMIDQNFFASDPDMP